MVVALGTHVYQTNHPPVEAHGYAFTEEELIAMLPDVAAILQDNEGRMELQTLLQGIASTEFADQALAQILRSIHEIETWQIGEAIAECYLRIHRNCYFPWPGSRDLKNPDSSPAGTDLVGFHMSETAPAQFGFAEVKTSSQNQYPPSLLYGRHGLKQQLNDLRDSAYVKDALVKYLGFHASGRAWANAYREAAARYLRSRSDVSIYGILIRDVTANPADCSGRAQQLSQDCPALILIELLALYLPAGSIATLPQRVPVE